MENKFMDEDFILKNEYAKILYHKYAEKLPIIDYHCHINPQEIYEDRKFENITQIWLGGDHYKWRLLRANGVEEDFVTGAASDHDKFIKFAETLERCIGNPVHQWSHLELKRYFGYDGPLNSKTAEEVWEICNKKIKEEPEKMSARGLIKASNVEVICTTDDPVDTLYWHERIAEDKSFTVKVLPAWRPDKAVNIEKPEYKSYIDLLGKTARIEIKDFDSLKEALKVRIAYFADHGCCIADHGLTDIPYKCSYTDAEINEIIKAALSGQTVSEENSNKYKLAIQVFLAGEYTEKGWVMQLHYGCKRNNNTRMFNRIGADTGYDAILGSDNGANLADFLDACDLNGRIASGLPKTILYSLNPNDNAVIETIMGCFQEVSALNKLQHGSAWWFNDNKAGMEAHLKSLANEGVLGNFVGMLTDSRSFLSYTRHEYFRRIMCNVLAEYVENGEYAWDEEILGGIAADLSYYNAKRYFNF
ncbi:MAG: glucuronate isomerase [Lachnospiraceae bacterium]|nr:glucuronate isomerase [Lachnospiraceae bacterium]